MPGASDGALLERSKEKEESSWKKSVVEIAVHFVQVKRNRCARFRIANSSALRFVALGTDTDNVVAMALVD